MIRLFVALELPAPARSALADVEVDPAVWRPVAPASLHVTLAFLGSREPSDVALIEPSLALEGAAPLLAFGDVLLLPPRRARVLTVALEDRSGTLGALQTRIAGALAAAGVYTPEARPFRPHVTVARLRPRVRPPGSAALALDPLEFRGEAVTLFASRLHPSGARYEPLYRVELD
jgi:2'-5' RNA ligase